MTTQPMDPVPRTEYEQFCKLYEIRHSELRLEIKDIETDAKAQYQALLNKIDALTNQVTSNGNDRWRSIALSCLSGVLGYALFYVQHLFMPK